MKISTFETYTKEPHSLTIEQMQSIHRELVAEIEKDSEAIELYEELITVATRYASIRAGWQQLSIEEKNDRDSARTSCHNSVITHFNMLARYLKMQGKQAKWRDELGYEEDDKYFRKTIGDFGCYLVFVNSLCARQDIFRKNGNNKRMNVQTECEMLSVQAMEAYARKYYVSGNDVVELFHENQVFEKMINLLEINFILLQQEDSDL